MRKEWGNILFTAVVAGIIGIISGFTSHYFNKQDIQKEKECLLVENKSLRGRINNLSQQGFIDLILPTNGENIISKTPYIHFQWDFKNKNKNNDIAYRLKIYNVNERHWIGEDTSKPFSDNHILQLKDGDYFWGIIPAFGTETPIKYSFFSKYSSVVQRVKSTKTLLIGTDRRFCNNFYTSKKNGITIYKGFDADLISWIADKLGTDWEIKDRNWNDLLPDLKAKKFDVVISAMTKTQYREDKYNIKFTDNYLQIHSVFIKKGSPATGDFTKEFKGKTVGVVTETTNEKAADFLWKNHSDLFPFKDIKKYNLYMDVFIALENSDVDFILVDDVLAKEYTQGNTFSEFHTQSLDNSLNAFYKNEVLQKDSEGYAIAVADESGPEGNLLELINKILRSDEGKTKIQQLQKEAYK